MATYCRDQFTPVKAEEGLTGTFRSDGSIGFYTNLLQAFPENVLKDLDMEGRCVSTQHTFSSDGDATSNVVIINVYCPRADSDNEDRMLYKLNFYHALELRCRELQKNGFSIIVLGDINTSHKLIDHCEPEDVDSFGKTPSRQWLDNFLTTSSETSNEEEEEEGKLTDSFRHLYPDKEKCFTCWNTKINARINNYGTRIDYIFLTSKLVCKLDDCIILSEVQGSDHCPVRALLKLEIIPSPKAPASCTKYFKEFSGKQQTMLQFVCNKRSHDVALGKHGQGSNEAKKIKTTTKQQSSLLSFFSQGSNSSSSNSTQSIAETKPNDDAFKFEEIASSAASVSSNNNNIQQLWKNFFKGENVMLLLIK